ncbi:MAG: hypothetical protein GOMPHAMPRED_004278 [Gomphillus americanus]|uniref:Uncharacterized protein n=1 Tax=Gomphillus americanus TaxID=1940652 RepID=A0A8H3IPT7_9LECA|nr:MAG: hypothetical protein GOMPHAMPRED_004278 [Gomphillus americanus]
MLLTRSYKANDRDHVSLASGTALPQDRLPRYFAKNGPLDADPKGVKKEGNGRGGWGSAGTEAQDYGYNFNQARRRSNSSANTDLADFKTKFEVDDEPVFEESLHGPREEVEDDASGSSSGSSIDEAESKQA